MDRAAFVAAMTFQGVPIEKANREADRRYVTQPSPDDERRLERSTRELEKAEQREVTNRFRVCGFTVRNLSQPRATKQSPGFPDLWITGNGVGLWWETKRQIGGKYSPAQLEFRNDCHACGVGCLGGDRYDAERWLVLARFATMGTDGQITPMRQDDR